MYKEFSCGCYFEWHRGEMHAEPCSVEHQTWIETLTMEA